MEEQIVRYIIIFFIGFSAGVVFDKTIEIWWK